MEEDQFGYLLKAEAEEHEAQMFHDLYTPEPSGHQYFYWRRLRLTWGCKHPYDKSEVTRIHSLTDRATGS